MRRTIIRALGAGLTVLLIATGCTSESQPQPPAGATLRSRALDAVDLAVVTEDGHIGVLVGTLINTRASPDTLIDVSVTSGLGPVRTVLLDGPIVLPPRKRVRLSATSRLAVSGTLSTGRLVTTRLTFSQSPALSVPTPVQRREPHHRHLKIPQPQDLATQ